MSLVYVYSVTVPNQSSYTPFRYKIISTEMLVHHCASTIFTSSAHKLLWPRSNWQSQFCPVISQPPSARQHPHTLPVVAATSNINFAMPHFDGVDTLLSPAFAVAAFALTEHDVAAAQPGCVRGRDTSDGSSTWYGHTSSTAEVRCEG
jgi:membrane-bound metal-dependent hydrolase YbcI (DUF457 family)